MGDHDSSTDTSRQLEDTKNDDYDPDAGLSEAERQANVSISYNLLVFVIIKTSPKITDRRGSSYGDSI